MKPYKQAASSQMSQEVDFPRGLTPEMICAHSLILQLPHCLLSHSALESFPVKTLLPGSWLLQIRELSPSLSLSSKLCGEWSPSPASTSLSFTSHPAAGVPLPSDTAHTKMPNNLVTKNQRPLPHPHLKWILRRTSCHCPHAASWRPLFCLFHFFPAS